MVRRLGVADSDASIVLRAAEHGLGGGGLPCRACATSSLSGGDRLLAGCFMSRIARSTRAVPQTTLAVQNEPDLQDLLLGQRPLLADRNAYLASAFRADCGNSGLSQQLEFSCQLPEHDGLRRSCSWNADIRLTRFAKKYWSSEKGVAL